MIPLHIIAGLTALTFGTLALIAGKGGGLHRGAGTVFVYAIMMMASIGAAVGALRSEPVNVVAGSLTFYLVSTAWLTVRRPAWAFARIDVVLAAFAMLLGLASFAVGATAVGKPQGPTIALIPFGSVAILASVADFRALRRQRVGRQRIARHLWRMGLAFWIATASFFLGQAKVFPESVRSSGVLAIPVVMVLVVVVYWVVRIAFVRRHKMAWET